jgi:hypothetical protein
LKIIWSSDTSEILLYYCRTLTKDIDDNNNSKESEIEIQSGQTNYQLETSNYEFADPVCLFEMQVSPQFISEEA